MSGEVAYLALIIAAFLFFIVEVGGLQSSLSREPGGQAEMSAGPAGAHRALSARVAPTCGRAEFPFDWRGSIWRSAS